MAGARAKSGASANVIELRDSTVYETATLLTLTHVSEGLNATSVLLVHVIFGSRS